jgi:Ca2+-binding RTX toxin-like protein
MRKVTLMLAAMALMVALFAAVAYAATIVGTRGGDQLYESQKRDTISGRSGMDIIDATTFPDDTDLVKGNRGADTINVNDHDTLDRVNGGKGVDTCVGDFGDNLNCENESFTIP